MRASSVRSIKPAIDLGEICRAEKVLRFALPEGKDIEPSPERPVVIKGRVVRERFPISGAIRVSGEPLGSLNQASHSRGKLDAVVGSGK